jgi:hypothetical protein
MQQAKPTDAQGVTVKLTAIDPNGNFQDLGAVTSDMSGMFKKMWTPPIPGEYAITATFEGTYSYAPSSASTAAGIQENPSASVSPAVSPTSPPTSPSSSPETPQPPTSPSASPTSAVQPPAVGMPVATYLAIGIAVIIVIAAAAALVLRRRK